MSFPNLSALAVRERAVTLFFLLMSLVAGTVSFLELGRAEDPVNKMKMLVITAVWPGANNQEMEDIVVRKLEKKVQEIENLDRVQTSIRDGRADILVTFHDYTTNAQFRDLQYQIRKRMQDIKPELPPELQGPYVNDDFTDVYFSLIALQAPRLPLADLTREAERLRDQLGRIEGVLKVNLIGERPERVYIDFDNIKLANLGLSVADAFAAIEAFNRVTPAGFIETAGQTLLLRTDASLAELDRLALMPLKIGEAVIPLKDIARITHGYEEPTRFEIHANGENSLLLGVIMQEGYNGLHLGKSIKQLLAQERTTMPLGIDLIELADQSEAIAKAISLFQVKFLVAVAVVTGIGFLALGLRAGLIVGIAVPTTLGLTFLLMNATHINLDRITLGALIIALGLLVDDAVIAIEMMLVKLEQGWDKITAASHAWNVTAAPMLFGTLITMFGFVPIGFAKSGVGEYAGNIFWVLAYSLLISWLVAVTFVPYLGVKLLTNRFMPSAVVQHQHANVYESTAYQKLRDVITFCVQHRGWTVTITAGLLLLAFAGMAGPVQKQFFPGSDRPEVVITVNLPAGTHINTTESVVRRLETFLSGRTDIRHYSAYIGGGAPRFFISISTEYPNPAFAKLVVVARDHHARDTLIKELQQRIAKGEFPEARLRMSTLLFGPPVQWPVSFRVIGPDPDRLRQLATEVSTVMMQNPHVVEPIWEWDERVPRLHLDIDNDRLTQIGLTPTEVSRIMLFRTQGLPLTSLRQNIRHVEVLARARDEADAPPVYELINNQGQKLPLSQIGKFEVRYEESLVRRHKGERFLEIMTDIENAQPQDVTKDIWNKLASLRQTLPAGYHLEIGGSFEQSVKAEASINKVFPLMACLMLVAIMLQMRSFAGVFVVVATAPLGVIGAVITLLIFRQPFGFVAMLGLIGLGGILMRNTLILTQQVRDNLQAGWSANKAVIEASVMRARPVALTAIAAALAFIPLASDSFWGPLAYVLIGGVLVGTLITLLFVPALYSLCIGKQQEHKQQEQMPT